MITLDLVTPSKKIVENAKVSSLKIPTQMGQIEVLPGSTEILTILDVGQLSFDQEGKGKRHFAISYGFAEVRKDKVIILAETCEENSQINIERAQKAQQESEVKLKGLLLGNEFNKQQLKHQRAVIRQQVAKT